MFSLWKKCSSDEVAFCLRLESHICFSPLTARRRVYPSDRRVKTASSMSALLTTDYSPNTDILTQSHTSQRVLFTWKYYSTEGSTWSVS